MKNQIKSFLNFSLDTVNPFNFFIISNLAFHCFCWIIIQTQDYESVAWIFRIIYGITGLKFFIAYFILCTAMHFLINLIEWIMPENIESRKYAYFEKQKYLRRLKFET